MVYFEYAVRTVEDSAVVGKLYSRYTNGYSKYTSWSSHACW